MSTKSTSTNKAAQAAIEVFASTTGRTDRVAIPIAGHDASAEENEGSGAAGLDMKLYNFFTQTVIDRIEPLAKQDMDADRYEQFLSSLNKEIQALVEKAVVLYKQHMT